MRLKTTRKAAIDLDGAETLAISALAFLAEDGERLARFLALSGLEPADLKAAAGTREMQAALLEYLLGEESLLLMFAANHGVTPESIGTACRLLAGTDRQF